MRRGRPNMLPGIPVEDLLMYLAQCRARVRAELLDESFTHRTKGLERVRLSATTELGQHELSGQAFVERMVGNHRGDLLATTHRGVPLAAPASLRSRATASRSASSAVRTSFNHGVSSDANGIPRHIASALSNRRVGLPRVRRCARTARQLAEANVDRSTTDQL